MKMFGVSLERFEKRYKNLSKQIERFPQLNGEIVGVDGSNSELIAGRFTDAFLPGAVGCTLSHVDVYRRMAIQNVDVAVIIEDDVIIPDNFVETLEYIEEAIRPGEVISLYSRTIERARFSALDTKSVGDAALYFPLDPRHVRTTAAYVIHSDAAKRIADGNDPVIYLADDWAKFHQEGWISRIRLLMPTGIRLTSEESTIETGTGAGWKRSLRSVIRRSEALGPMRAIRRRMLLLKQEGNYEIVNERSSLANSVWP